MTAAKRRNGLDWALLSIAAAVGGLALAIALSGLFAWLGPGGLTPVNKYQFNMWIVPPLWLVPASLVWLCRTGWRAVGAMTLANLFAWGALAAVQVLAGQAPAG